MVSPVVSAAGVVAVLVYVVVPKRSQASRVASPAAAAEWSGVKCRPSRASLAAATSGDNDDGDARM